MSEASWSDDSLRLIFERYSKPLPDRAEFLRKRLGRVNASNGELAIRLVPKALELACMVREEGPAAIDGFLQRLKPRDRAHLPIILAALVDIDRSAEELLSWVTWDNAQAHTRRLSAMQQEDQSDAA